MPLRDLHYRGACATPRRQRPDLRRAAEAVSFRVVGGQFMNNRRIQKVAVLCGMGVGLTLAACTSGEKPDIADPTSQRTAPAGSYIGTRDMSGNHVWRGIPYAAAPTGDRRWRAPVPAAPRANLFSAIDPGPACPQFASRFGGESGASKELRGDENCLTLDIYAPREIAPDETLPVMVWIHGGGNTIGNSSFYQGAELVRNGRVVVVAIQYRMGPLGFLRHASLRNDRDPVEASGNFAILDMIESLRWVRTNIRAFGGNPDNITIFGESAGGRNVFSLLLAPQAAGLFHRAISQSGSLGAHTAAEAENSTDATPPGHPRSSTEVLYTLLQQDGRAANREQARTQLATMSDSETAAYLRSKTTQEIFDAYADGEMLGMIDMPRTLRDGTVLPAGDPLDSLQAGNFNHVPVILGTNRDEQKLFLAADPDMTTAWLGWLPRIKDPRRYEAFARHASRNWKAVGADEPAAAMRASGHPDVWVYRFDWDEEGELLGTDFSQLIGAGHAIEIPFIFGNYDMGSELSLLFTDENKAGRKELESAMIGYWSTFAKTGTPGNGGDPARATWPRGPEFLLLDTEAGGGLRPSTDTLTERLVLQEIVQDSDLSPLERCEVLRRTLERQIRPDRGVLAKAGC
ncbi:MAG TPA: carboxylesterase [Deltaproteobacteria bacterium]|nr:carboxylesterase [Deltaproteobacteria bacterium]